VIQEVIQEVILQVRKVVTLLRLQTKKKNLKEEEEKLKLYANLQKSRWTTLPLLLDDLREINLIERKKRDLKFYKFLELNNVNLSNLRLSKDFYLLDHGLSNIRIGFAMTVENFTGRKILKEVMRDEFRVVDSNSFKLYSNLEEEKFGSCFEIDRYLQPCLRNVLTKKVIIEPVISPYVGGCFCCFPDRIEELCSLMTSNSIVQNETIEEVINLQWPLVHETTFNKTKIVNYSEKNYYSY